MEKLTKDLPLSFDHDFDLWEKSIPLFELPWLPSVDFKKYKQKPISYNETGDTWEFEWRYGLLGILPRAGYPTLYPCLFIDGGMNDKATGLYFPKTPVGIDSHTDLKNFKVNIKATNLTPDKIYQAYPALALQTSDKRPLVFDTQQTVTSKLVDVTLKSVEVKPYYTEDQKLSELGYHGFEIIGHVSVRGAAKVDRWGLFFKPYEDADMKQNDFTRDKVKETNDQPVTFYVVTKRDVINTTMHGDYVVWKTNENGEREATLPLPMNTLPIYGEWTDAFDFSDSRRLVPQARSTAEWPEKVRRQIDNIIKNRPFYDTTPIVISE